MSVPGLQLAQSGATSETRPLAFLPPLGNTNTLPGQFDPGVSPVVQICELSGNACAATVAEFTSTTGPGSETVRVSAGEEHYIVNWHTNQFDLDTAKMYRIRVRDGTSELGYADIKPVSSGQSLRRSRTEEVIPLLNGRTLPIKFWIGAPVLGGVPAQAPDTLPAYVFDDANIYNSVCISGEVGREILVVLAEDQGSPAAEGARAQPACPGPQRRALATTVRSASTCARPRKRG